MKRRGMLMATGIGSIAVVVIFWAAVVHGRSAWYPLYVAATGPRTVEDVLRRVGGAAEQRLTPHFKKAGVSLPATELLLLGLKEERRLELWARDGKGNDDAWIFVRAYPFHAASGGTGPKLREGDLQVPEGIYKAEHLNPNSSYHLSIKVNYPNAFDRQMAAVEKRTRLGGDIFIHGKNVSIGCIAIGDEAIEEVFTAVARTGISRTQIWIAPFDLRTRPPPSSGPAWTQSVYDELARKIRTLGTAH